MPLEIKDLRGDAEFAALPVEEQRKVVLRLDPEFGGLPKAEQDKVLTTLAPPPRSLLAPRVQAKELLGTPGAGAFASGLATMALTPPPFQPLGFVAGAGGALMAEEGTRRLQEQFGETPGGIAGLLLSLGTGLGTGLAGRLKLPSSRIEQPTIQPPSAGIPAAAKVSGEAGAAMPTSAKSLPPVTQAEPVQVSTLAEPSVSSTTRRMTPSETAGPSATLETPTAATGWTSTPKVIQPSNDVKEMIRYAEAGEGVFQPDLKQIAEEVPGVKLVGVRVKDQAGIERKLNKGHAPNTISDYLGGRVAIDEPGQLEQALAAIRSRFEILNVDNFLTTPRNGGYRAIHLQVRLSNGMSAELQVVPRPIAQIQEAEHKAFYEVWRGKSELTFEEWPAYQRAFKQSSRDYGDAWAQDESWAKYGQAAPEAAAPPPKPAAPPRVPEPPATAIVPPGIEPPSPLTTTVLTEPATQEVATSAKTAAAQLLTAERTDPGKRLYRRVIDLMDRGELDLPSIPGILQRSGQSMTAFVEEYAKTYSQAGRQMKQLSDLRKFLDRAAATDPALRDALTALDRAAPNIQDTFWNRLKDVYQSVDDVRRASLTGQLATSVRNILSQTGRYSLEILDQAVQGLVSGQGLRNAPELIAAIAGRFSRAGRATVDRLLGAFPVEQARLTATPTGEVTLGTKYAKLVNMVNIVQEQFFRRAAFDATVRGELARRGLNVQEMLANPGKIPAEIIELASDRAMELTFAAGPKGGTFGRAIMDAYRAIPMLTTINPFPRFLANSYKFLVDFSPAGYLRLLKTSEASKIVRGAQESQAAFQARLAGATAKDQDFTAEALSRASLGTGMLAMAAAARELAGGAHWYELQFGNQKVDARPFAPFSTYLFMYEVMKTMGELGVDVVKDGKTLQQAMIEHGRMSTSDLVQGMLSINRIAGTGLVALDLIKAGAFDRKMDLLRDFLAQYIGGFTVPFRTIKDFMAGVSPEEAKLRDVRENLLGPTLSNLPGASQTLPEAPSPLRADQPAAEHPVLRQTTGLSIRESRPIEEELGRLGVELNQVNPRTGDAEVDREIARRMGQLVDAGWLETVVTSRQYQALKPSERRLLLLGAGPYGAGILTAMRRQAYQATMQQRPDLAVRMGLKRIPGTAKDIGIERGIIEER